ncbi:MAG: Ppx/GppA phosphatase family protein [Verrucomicrobiaceae bacterium]
MESPSPTLSAAIHIGASHASMIVVASPKIPGDPPETIDFFEKNIPLGRDIFRHGVVLPTTIEQAVKVVKGFQESLAEQGMGDIPVRAATTNTLIEARNSEVFINRLQIACGWRFTPLDDGEMTRLLFLKTRRRLRDTPSMRKRTTIVVHVGPGNTRVLLFKKGRIIRYHSYRLGTHRTWERLNSPDLTGKAITNLIREQISGMIAQLYFDFHTEEIEDLVMIGTEVQTLSPFLSKPDKTKSRYAVLQQLTEDIASVTENERVKRFRLDYQTAGSALPALVINSVIAETFGLKSLRVSPSDYERGLLADLAIPPDLEGELRRQLLHSAEVTAIRYDVDLKHAYHVAHLCQQLFDATTALHHLDAHDSLLLEVASVLHETGNHISPKAHQLHSFYLVQHSEIFGLSDTDRLIVALITRYHRKETPQADHEAYTQLPASDRMRVAKLSALIRVADALERSHSQRVKNISVELSDKKITLTLDGVRDATAERLALPSKANLFQELYGLTVILKETA